MRRWRDVMTVLLPLLFTAQAFAQAPAVRDCRDDNGVDRCDPQEQRRMLALFGLLPVEDHVEAGSQLRRAHYVDGYGREVVAVVFIRPRGEDPVLRVHFPRRGSEARIDPLQAPVPAEIWENVLRRSDHFDRDLVPVPAGGPIICMHSWVYTVEAVDPARGPNLPATVRRRTGDACDDDLVQAYAWELQEEAIRLLPHCDRLDPEMHRNSATRLAACAMLGGDRLAAATVHNLASRLSRIDGPSDERIAGGLFDYRATLSWNGERIGGDGGLAARAWAQRIGGEAGGNFFITAVRGESADRVVVEGLLSRVEERPDEQPDIYLNAPVEQVWTRRYGNDFSIENATIGAFAPVRRD